MLKAYVRRFDGSTHPVGLRQHGQHIGAHEDKVRFARLWWRDTLPQDDGEEAGRSVLLDSVPLVDTLILTRVGPQGERVIFHGLMTEVSADTGEQISVMAVDNPKNDRTYQQLVEHPFSLDGPLHPSDSAPLFAAPAEQQPHQQGEVRTLGGARHQSIRVERVDHPQSADPAARPGGHPAAPPAGQWQQPYGAPPPRAEGVPATADA